MHLKASWLSLLLAIIHAVSGLTLLLFSSWFIAACAVAGVQFNYMLPAVIIRALALLKIASGYSEMWFAHHGLLQHLAAIRLKLFNNMQGQSSISRGADTDKLNYQSHDVASLWAGWINQNSGALVSLTLLTVWVLASLPVFSFLWCTFLAVSIFIYLALLMSGLALSEKRLAVRAQLESTIEHHFDAASLWHMHKNLSHPNGEVLYDLVIKNQRKIEWAISFLLGLSLIVTVFVLLNMEAVQTNRSLVIVLPMALLTSIDWFGRTFYSQHRLHDYISAKKSLSGQKTHHERTRLSTVINRLQLIDFKPLVNGNTLVNITIEKNQRVLISGSSGAGKSRLMQAVAGLIPYDGDRLINNEITRDVLLDDTLYIEQNPYCLSGTLRQNILVANDKTTDEKIIETLKQVGLDYLTDLDQWLGAVGRALSGGETKRLGMARALVSTKSLLLIDEPFEGLDTQNIAKVVTLINKLAQSRTVVIASHIFPETLLFEQHIRL